MNRLIRDMPPEEYHRDPCREPSLSASAAHTLVARSPRHAWLYHPRLGKRGHERESTDAMEMGTIVHQLLLGRGDCFAVAEYVPDTADDALAALADRYAEEGDAALSTPPEPTPKGRKPRAKKPPEPPPAGPDGRPEFADWRSAAARRARDEIRARGRIPLLPKDKRIADALARRVRTALEDFEIDLTDGYPEAVAMWEEQSDDGTAVQCRGMLDLWQPSTGTIYDLKIVKSASPRAAQSHLVGLGGDIQAAAYTRAIETIYPQAAGRVRFVFLFCETSTGVVTPVQLAGSMRELGARRWRRAINTWARCLRADHWPGYVETPAIVEAPDWALASEIDAMGKESFVNWQDRSTQDDPSEDGGHHEGHDHEAIEDIF